MINKKTYIFIQIFLIAFSAHAQEPVKLTLENAIEMAMENNVEIKKAENNLKSSRRMELGSYAELFPSVAFNAGVNRSTGRNFDQVAGEVRTESGDFANASFNASWDILNLMRKISKVRSSRFNSLSKLWGLEETKNFIALEVLRNYVEVLRNNEQVKILTEFIKSQKKSLELTEVQVKLGIRVKQDFYTQKAELSNLRSMLLNAQNLSQIANNELVLLLNISANDNILLEDKLIFSSQNSDLKNETATKLCEMALSQRNNLKRAEAEVKIQKYKLFESRGTYYPAVSLFYNYGTNYSSFQEGDYRQQFYTDNITKVFGASITIPIFNGLLNRTKVFQAKTDYKNSELDSEQLKNESCIEVSNVLNSIKSTELEIQFRNDQLEASKLAYELEQEKYKLGASTPVTLSIAQRDYIESVLMHNQAKYQFIYNLRELDFFCGMLVI